MFQLNDVIGQLYDFISERQREASRSVTPHVQVCVLITLSGVQIEYLNIVAANMWLKGFIHKKPAKRGQRGHVTYTNGAHHGHLLPVTKGLHCGLQF